VAQPARGNQDVEVTLDFLGYAHIETGL
jgi:hypothetical protein